MPATAEFYPAFILGNGPTLPKDLSCLDRFFAVGTNRILYRYDPTVLMWLDKTVYKDIAEALKTAKCLCLVRDEICPEWAYPLRATGHLEGPDTFIDCKSAGVSAAYWALALGCKPVYLLGMSAEGENFYGHNRYRTPASTRRMQQATDALLRYPNVYPITSDTLESVVKILRPHARSQEHYRKRVASLYPGVHPGQLPRTAG